MVDSFSSLFALDAIQNLDEQAARVVDLAYWNEADVQLREHTRHKITSANWNGQIVSPIWGIIIGCNFDKATRRRLLTHLESIIAHDQIKELREFADTFSYYITNNRSVVYDIAETEFGHLGEVALKALEIEGGDAWTWISKAFSGIWQWDENGVMCDQYEVEENAYSNDDISSTILQLVDAITASDEYLKYKSGFEI
jgi:hypothetical protein